MPRDASRRSTVTALAAIGALALLVACDEPGPAALAPDLDPDFAAHAGGPAGGPPMTARTTQAGHFHACALGNDQRAYCWGANDRGQLGDGTTTPSTRPVPVAGGHRFSELAVGTDHTCALTAAGATLCWGANQAGQLGDGTTTDRSTPVPVTGGNAFVRITSGFAHSCGLDAAGQASCWGRNQTGDLGDGTTVARSVPAPVAGGHAFRAIDAGLGSTCALDQDGEAHCWGWNAFSQLGNGSLQDALVPTPLAGGLRFASISQGAIHGCGVTHDGEAYCWGGRSFIYGQLGHGQVGESPVPVPVAGGLRFQQVSASAANYIFTITCGVTTGGEAYCWGANRDGALGSSAALDTCHNAQFGDFPCAHAPVPVDGGIAFTEVSTGLGFACGTGGRGAYCWGRNDQGQHGNGTLDPSAHPVRVLGPAPGSRGRQGGGPPAQPAAMKVKP